MISLASFREARYTVPYRGRVAEWLKAPVLKTGKG